METQWISVEKPIKPICINGISSNLCSSIRNKDCDCLIYENEIKEWKELTQDIGEVIAFNEKWIDPDFNPKGIRVGFINGDGNFYSAQWNDYQDTYQNDEKHLPSHWMPLPSPPVQQL